MCDCLRGGGWIDYSAKPFEVVLKRDGYRCISCRTASCLQIHSLFPLNASNYAPDISVTVCFDCHRRISKKEISIKNNKIAECLLKKWVELHPRAIEVFKEYLPVSITGEIDEKSETKNKD